MSCRSDVSLKAMDGRKQDGGRVVRRRILRENSTASACLPILDRSLELLNDRVTCSRGGYSVTLSRRGCVQRSAFANFEYSNNNTPRILCLSSRSLVSFCYRYISAIPQSSAYEYLPDWQLGWQASINNIQFDPLPLVSSITQCTVWRYKRRPRYLEKRRPPLFSRRGALGVTTILDK